MRRHLLAALGTLAALALAVPVASAHQGNPNMESIITGVTPKTPGITLQVLNRDDRFELTNRSRQDVLILGYQDEPYARVLADGTVEQNVNSPAYYLNDDRYANVEVPATATAKATPRWKVLDRTGSFQWHDHRMHYMGKGTPPAVRDEARRQKLQDYTIPIRIGSATGAITGAYWWSPQKDGGPPTGAIVALAALVLAGAGAVVVTRRRRARGAPSGNEPVEAW